MNERRLTWVILLACAGLLAGCSGERSDSFSRDGGDGDAQGDTESDASSEGADGGAPDDAGDPALSEDAGPVGCVAPTSGPTMHAGDVMGTETWTAQGSPHVVTANVNVRGGAKLIVEPCAVVQFAAGTSLNVAYPTTPNQGELVAQGTAAQPIRFEPLADARWDHVFVQAPGSASLAYLTLAGGGGQNTSAGESLLGTGDGELPSDAVIALDHVSIDGSLGAGLKLTRDARLTAASSSLVVQDSGSSDHPYPVELGELAIDTLPDGSYTGNLVDEILITTEIASGRGGILEDATIHDRGVPYHVGESEGIDHLRVGAPEGEPPVTLTIEPGVTLKFLPGTALTVEFATGTFPALGVLKAEGTAEKPIVFTSARATPAPGDWRGLWYGGIASDQNRLDHVVIDYSGADCSCVLVTCNVDVTEYEGAIIFTQPPPGVFMSNSAIRHGAGHGVVLGYDGNDYDFRASNTFEDLAGCIQTLPRSTTASCPDPEPVCVR